MTPTARTHSTKVTGEAAFAFDATLPNDPPTLAIVHDAAAAAPLLPFARCDSQAIVKT